MIGRLRKKVSEVRKSLLKRIYDILRANFWHYYYRFFPDKDDTGKIVSYLDAVELSQVTSTESYNDTLVPTVGMYNYPITTSGTLPAPIGTVNIKTVRKTHVGDKIVSTIFMEYIGDRSFEVYVINGNTEEKRFPNKKSALSEHYKLVNKYRGNRSGK